MQFLNEYNEIIGEGHKYPVSDSPLAISMFGKYFEEIGDAELTRLYTEIQNLKNNTSKRLTYNSLITQPFSRTIFSMIEDEYGYRNQQPLVNEIKEKEVETNKSQVQTEAHDQWTTKLNDLIKKHGALNWKSADIADIDRRDYPDFSDAYVSYIEFEDGTDVPEDLLDTVREAYPEEFYARVSS